MAHTLKSSNNLRLTHFAESLFKAVKAVGTAISDFFTAVMIAQSRSEELERLHNLTDVELATRYGITRDQIVAHVFRDRMY